MPVFKHPMHGLIAPFSLKEDQIRTKIEIVVKVKKGCYPCCFSISLLPLKGKGVGAAHQVCHSLWQAQECHEKLWARGRYRSRQTSLALYPRICCPIHENLCSQRRYLGAEKLCTWKLFGSQVHKLLGSHQVVHLGGWLFGSHQVVHLGGWSYPKCTGCWDPTLSSPFLTASAQNHRAPNYKCKKEANTSTNNTDT